MSTRQVANVLGSVLLVALVVPFVVYAVPGVVGAEYSFVVLSGSMEPTIEPGDVVVVDERAPTAIADGDVITFTRGDAETPVTHRVVDVRETETGPVFETKGDANDDVDSTPIPAANVIGVVVFTIPYIGYVIRATNSTVGFVLLVAVPLSLLVLTELWALVRHGSKPTDSDARVATDPTVSSADAAVTITANDLLLSTGVLALVTPYAVYVALELQTALTTAVAFASAFSLLAVGGLWLSMRLSAGEGDTASTSAREAEPPEPTTETAHPTADGGTLEEDD